jgi:hypothetical protein
VGFGECEREEINNNILKQQKKKLYCIKTRLDNNRLNGSKCLHYHTHAQIQIQVERIVCSAKYVNRASQLAQNDKSSTNTQCKRD